MLADITPLMLRCRADFDWRASYFAAIIISLIFADAMMLLILRYAAIRFRLRHEALSFDAMPCCIAMLPTPATPPAARQPTPR